MDGKISVAKVIENKAEKITAIWDHFSPLIGKVFIELETAQLLVDNNEWDDWFDLPIRLLFRPDLKVSVGWSHFDKLFLSKDDSLNFATDGCEVRWKTNYAASVCRVLGQSLESFALGGGRVDSWNDDSVDWTRIILDFETGWLEIYNGIDENSFSFHPEKPTGVFVRVCHI